MTSIEFRALEVALSSIDCNGQHFARITRQPDEFAITTVGGKGDRDVINRVASHSLAKETLMSVLTFSDLAMESPDDIQCITVIPEDRVMIEFSDGHVENVKIKSVPLSRKLKRMIQG